MKASPEHDDLLNEALLDENSAELRSRSLDCTLRAVRQQRRLRNAVRFASSVAVLGILTAILWHRQTPSIQPVAVQPAVIAAPTVPGTSIRLVSDEELLALFPDRPVALIGPLGERQFVFLDEKRTSRPREARPVKGQNL